MVCTKINGWNWFSYVTSTVEVRLMIWIIVFQGFFRVYFFLTSRPPWRTLVPPRGAAPHSLKTTALHTKRERAEHEWKCDDLLLWKLVCYKVVSCIRRWGVWWSDHIRSQRVLAFCMQFEEVWVPSMFWRKRQVGALTFYIFFSLLENTTELRNSMKCSYNIVRP